MTYDGKIKLIKRILDSNLLVFKNNLNTNSTDDMVDINHGRIVVLYSNYRLELLKYLNLRESNTLSKKLLITLFSHLSTTLGKRDEDINIIVLYHNTKQEALDLLRAVLNTCYLDNQINAIEEYLDNVFKYVDYTNIISTMRGKPVRKKVKGKKQH